MAGREEGGQQRTAQLAWARRVMADEFMHEYYSILYRVQTTEVFTGYNSTDTGFERTKAPYLQQTHSALEPYAASPDVPSGIAAGAP